MKAIKCILYSFILLNLLSCGNENLIPSDYVTWVNNSENGLLKKKTIPPLTVEALYKPLAYIIANEQRSNDISKEIYQARIEELGTLQYYTLKLGIIDEKLDVTNYEVTNNAQQQERLNYLSFSMQNDIKLIEGKDTLPCKVFHFERSYDLSSSRTFVLAFERTKSTNNQSKTLILDLPYFKTGPIKLNYKTSDLEAIPSLKL
jgi:hypothetical protein